MLLTTHDAMNLRLSQEQAHDYHEISPAAACFSFRRQLVHNISQGGPTMQSTLVFWLVPTRSGSFRTPANIKVLG
jgi:hypothetical protein